MVCSVGAAAAQSFTIVAPAAPGGGWDQTARVLQRVLAEIEPDVDVQVENVPGAAGTIGLARFVQSERGNPNAVLITGLVMVSGVIANGSPVTLAETTPIARLTGEYEVIGVPAASAHQSMRDLLEAFGRDPGAVSWGGGSAGGTDDLLVRLLAERVGLPASRVNYIAFPGGGPAVAALLGGQVTAGVGGYSEFAGQVEAGLLRVLAISAPSRVAGIDAPTLRESGVDLDLANWRGVVGPPGLSDAERDALIGRFSHVAQSPAWTRALQEYGWEDLFLPGVAFRQFLLGEQARVSPVLERLAAGDAAPGSRPFVPTPFTVPRLISAIFAVLVAASLVTRTRTGRSTGVQSTRVQTTGVQSTGVQSTGVRTTGVQSTGVQSTGVQSKGVRTTGVQSTAVQTTPVQSTMVQGTAVQGRSVHGDVHAPNDLVLTDRGLNVRGLNPRGASARGANLRGSCLAAVLLVQPWLYPLVGFVAASTLTFLVAASTVRGVRPTIARTLSDAATGAAVSALLYVAFTRGLGVQLPF
jgi:putative tricarboxylic transport membrane protein